MKTFGLFSLIFLLSGIAFAADGSNFFNLNNGSIQCLLAAKKYGPCAYQITGLSDINIADICGKFDNDQCKDFVNDVYDTTTGCENQDDKTIDSLIRRIRYVYIAGCSKDENGKLCPLTNLIQNRQNAFTTNDIDISIVQDSCSSENCKKQLNNIVDILPSTKPYIDEKKKSDDNTKDIPDEWIDATYNNIDTDKIKSYIDSDVCSKFTTGNNTEVAAANQTLAEGNDGNSSSDASNNILSSNIVFTTLVLITLMKYIL